MCELAGYDDKELGIDCRIEGFNITIEMLKNILTDKPTPITLPLDPNETLAQHHSERISAV